jgi:hypothetical protein
MRPLFLPLSCAVVVLGVGCSGTERAPLRPSANLASASSQSAIDTTPALAAAVSSVPDVSGMWNTTAAGYLTVPLSVVERLFGIEPEGPMTQLRCEGAGTMQLIQTGDTFTGLWIRKDTVCETRGGHVFVPPAMAFPISLLIAEGSITGRGVHFLLGQVAGLGCPHNGAITSVDGQRALELRANGRCIIPGHPQSPAPLDPPPLGTSHDTSFVAIRP